MPTTITTLKKRSDFLRLNRGHKYIAPSFILRYLPRPPATFPPSIPPAGGGDVRGGTAAADIGACRVGYTVTTKCGNAVIRNRIKRRLRALVRALAGSCIPGTDYVLIARADAEVSAADATDLRTQLEKALTSAAARLERA